MSQVLNCIQYQLQNYELPACMEGGGGYCSHCWRKKKEDRVCEVWQMIEQNCSPRMGSIMIKHFFPPTSLPPTSSCHPPSHISPLGIPNNHTVHLLTATVLIKSSVIAIHCNSSSLTLDLWALYSNNITGKGGARQGGGGGGRVRMMWSGREKKRGKIRGQVEKEEEENKEE